MKTLTLDRQPSRGERAAFSKARRLERRYATLLRKIARHVGDIVSAFAPDSFEQMQRAADALRRYSETIDPWARSVGERMVTEVAARDKQAWRSVSAEIGRGLAREIETAPTGEAMRRLMAEQVRLIKSLPLDAAERVHKLALEALSDGSRSKELAAEIMRTGQVTKSRAMLIARTETGRAATMLTQARAQHIGSTHFVWRTAGDSDVRETHKKLNGKTFRWDEPPECDPGAPRAARLHMELPLLCGACP